MFLGGEGRKTSPATLSPGSQIPGCAPGPEPRAARPPGRRSREGPSAPAAACPAPASRPLGGSRPPREPRPPVRPARRRTAGLPLATTPRARPARRPLPGSRAAPPRDHPAPADPLPGRPLAFPLRLQRHPLQPRPPQPPNPEHRPPPFRATAGDCPCPPPHNPAVTWRGCPGARSRGGGLAQCWSWHPARGGGPKNVPGNPQDKSAEGAAHDPRNPRSTRVLRWSG